MTHQSTTKENKPSTASMMSSRSMQACIDACTECAEVCESVVNYCLAKGGPHASPEHIKTLFSCVDICALSAKWMVRELDLHTESCALCEKVCLACADSCAKFSEDAEMKRCEEVCRKCAESCHEMAAHH